MWRPDGGFEDADFAGISEIEEVAVGADVALERSAVTELETVNQFVYYGPLAAVPAIGCHERLALVDTSIRRRRRSLETSAAVGGCAFGFGKTVKVNAG